MPENNFRHNRLFFLAVFRYVKNRFPFLL